MSSHHIYSGICEKCATNYQTSSSWGSKRFCSRVCANSRDRPQELRDRVGTTLTSKYATNLLPRRVPHNKGVTKHLPNNCVVCGKLTKPYRVTCSRICFSELTRQNALKQEKHGGGHKGRYKGIPCDSTYELAFLIWNLDHSVSITRCENIYPYSYKGKMSSYKPDFVIEGQEIEIKGFMSERAQAKLDQNPHVFVVDKVEIQSFIKYVKYTYKVKDLRDLYDVKGHQISCNHCNSMFTQGYKTQMYCCVSCSASARHIIKKLFRGPGFEPG